MSVATYTVGLLVALGNSVELSTFQVNGEDVEDGGSLDLAPLTSSVDVVVETVDLDASYEVAGDSGLVVGANTLTVTVTAADGETVAVYTVTLNVPLNNDASLAVFTVNGVAVEDGGSVDVDYGTSEVEVVATPTDLDATVVVSGNTELQSGENTLTVTVTAADGETVASYTVTVNVALNNDTSLAVFTVNGEDVADGDVVELVAYTAEVEVVATATDENASVEVSGNTDLQSGENTLTVTVTAQNGDVASYVVTLLVLLSDDTSLATFTVNGVDVADGDVVELASYTTEVEFEVVATDENASVQVTGGTELVAGENALTVVVTA
ncbi:MAG: hypothetical protein EBU72_14515, partial [Betaproteobacteria bacterium]|nr:hypothetical protein [Betaproteobacteria bacterium]